MTYDDIVAKVSEELGIPKGIVDRTYRAYWRAVMDHIAALPLKDDLTDEEFLKLQPNVNVPSIGKLYVTLDRYKKVNATHERIVKMQQEKLKDSEDIGDSEDSNDLES